MFKLLIGLLLAYAAYWSWKEWKSWQAQDERQEDMLENLDSAKIELEDVELGHKVMDIKEEVKKEKSKLDKRIDKLNND